MRCRECGEEMPDRAQVCGKCGTPVLTEAEMPTGPAEAEPREPIPESRRQADRGAAVRRQADIYDRARSTYYGTAGGGMTRDPNRREEDGGETDHRELCVKTGILLLFLSVPAVLAPVLMIPLGIAAFCLGVMGLKSSRENAAWTIIVLGAAQTMVGMVLTLVAAMLLPYVDELADVLTGTLN